MFKLLLWFLFLLLLAVGFTWLADRPGILTITWLGREIEMPLVVAVVLVIILTAALLFVWNLLRQLLRSPRAAREYLRFRKHRKGYEALSKGIIAASAGDAQSAARNAALAGNALSDEPLVNVLAAQAAQLKGDKANVKRIFEEMTRQRDTELLGLRGLFSEARNSGDLVAALTFAERAVVLNPRLPWASSAVLQVQTARKAWESAAITLDQQARNGLMERKEADRKRAAMLAAEALAAEESDRPKALKLAYAALDLDPGLVPAAALAARRHIAEGGTRKAMKVLRAAWAKSPHPELADLIARADPTEGVEARFERVRDTVGEPQANLESAVALAKAALAAGRLEVAREALAQWSESQPQARVCALLARIEDAAGDKGRAREWLARAIHAPRDPIWVSDGVANARWMPVSPVTGEIVRCEWKTPFDMPALEESPHAAAQDEAAAARAALPAQQVPEEGNAVRPPVPDDPGVGHTEEPA
jgi:HemY protein